MVCSFPNEFNQFEHNPNQELIDWSFRSSGLSKEAFKKVKGTGPIAAYMYPFCYDIKRYQTLLLMVFSLYIIDEHTEPNYIGIDKNYDQVRRTWRQAGQMFEKLQGEKHVSMCEWDPFIMAMYAMLEDIYVTYNEEQKKRFINAWLDHIQGNLEEIDHVSSERSIES